VAQGECHQAQGEQVSLQQTMVRQGRCRYDAPGMLDMSESNPIAAYTLSPANAVTVLPERGYYRPEHDTGLQIVYEDEALIVLNKPNGLLSVPGKKTVSTQDSLAGRVQAQFPGAMIVHRLDMATSGLIVMARGLQVRRLLGCAFEQRQIKKQYIAIVDGCPAKTRGHIDLPLIRDWPNRPKQKVDMEQGKSALTNYKVLEYYQQADATRIELEPVTGRSHQLRVHMCSIGHAILGDRLYANEAARAKSPRLLLHAASLTLQHPITGQEISFSSAVPF